MTNIAELLLRQFQYWRASLLVGATAAIALSFVFADESVAARPKGTREGQALERIIDALTRNEIVVLSIIATFAIGGALCSISYGAVLAVREIMLKWVNFSVPVSEWSAIQRFASPVREEEMHVLQQRMNETSEYSDLPASDRRHAFNRFTKDTVRNPLILPLVNNDPLGDASLRSITNTRLYGGLIAPGTTLALLLARSFDSPAWLFLVVGIAVFTFLVFKTASESRKTYSLLARAGSEDRNLLAAHARLALEASRGRQEIQSARAASI